MVRIACSSFGHDRKEAGNEPHQGPPENARGPISVLTLYAGRGQSGSIAIVLGTAVIVDDHEGFRAFARAFLEASGFDVIGEAGDGAGAVETIERLDPDIVLLDVLLPDIDGFEVVRRVLEGGGRAAIILTSTREAADYGTKVGLAGIRGFIGKGDLSRQRLEAVLWGNGAGS
jgi:two-component system, NarL family, nitrate/nitrite response regulator NarL